MEKVLTLKMITKEALYTAYADAIVEKTYIVGGRKRKINKHGDYSKFAHDLHNEDSCQNNYFYHRDNTHP
jgi:hypothetical protein